MKKFQKCHNFSKKVMMADEGKKVDPRIRQDPTSILTRANRFSLIMMDSDKFIEI